MKCNPGRLDPPGDQSPGYPAVPGEPGLKRRASKLSWERTFPFLVSLYLLLCLMGCQPDSGPITVTRATLQATATDSATLTPSPTEVATTPAPTLTAAPAATTIPPTMEPATITPSPTAVGWSITDWSNFLLREEGDQLYLLRPGQTSQLITEGKLTGGQPWSPDGTKFIFSDSPAFRETPSPELIMVDLTTGQTSVINLLNRAYDIFWSPNEKYLLYTAGGLDHAIQIVLYDFETQENKVLTEIIRERAGFFYLVGWSPDGRKIAYVSEVNGQIDLFVLEMESLAVQQLTNTPDIETLAIWSTTEEQLLFGTINDSEHALEVWPYGAQTLYLVDGSGANLTRLDGSYYVFFAAWSPDGETIAYSNYAQLCILDMTSLSEVCPLEDTPPYNDYFAIGGPPSWSADGKWLAFQATGHKVSQCYKVYILEVSTSMVTPVDLGTCGVDPFYWSRAVP